MFENEACGNISIKKLNKYLSKIDRLFLNRLYFWSSHRKSYGIEKDGKVWIYNTLEDWSEQLGVSKSSTRRAIKSLKDKKIIDSCYLSVNKRNRTLYYSINYNETSKYLTKSVGLACVQKTGTSDNVREHMGEHMYIIDNSKQIINKSYKSIKNESQKNLEPVIRETPTIAQDMLKIWNDEFGSKAVLTKDLARFLVAAFKTKFKSCLREWKKYLKIIKTSLYLMSEKFKLSIWWTVKFFTIDRIRGGELGVKPNNIIVENDELEEKLEQHLQSLKEAESCKKLRYKIIEKLSLPTYLSWFIHVKFIESADHGSETKTRVVMKTENQFVEDWIKNNFAEKCGLCMG